MEIDDLKKSWDEGFNSAAMESNLNEIRLKGKESPLSKLEQKTRIAIWIFPFVAVLFAATFYEHPLARYSPAMWLLLFILFTEFVFSIFNLTVIKKIQNAQGNIRENLVNRIKVLSKGFKQFLTLYVSLYVLMVVLLEISMYYQADALFEDWHRIPFAIRTIVYILALAVVYRAKRSSQQKHYGNYLAQLKTLIDQIN